MTWLKLTHQNLYLMKDDRDQYLQKVALRPHGDNQAVDIPFDWFSDNNRPRAVTVVRNSEAVEPTAYEEPKPTYPKNDLASRILRYMQTKGYTIFDRPKEYNIVYVEGMNVDGSLNGDAHNVFNDIRLVIEVKDNQPHIAGGPWVATTEPGEYYTNRPPVSEGVARIQFNQFEAWRVGQHCGQTSGCHEALVQVKPITVHRDSNKDKKRTGDKLYTDLFGINQHHGYDFHKDDIQTASAGCLVGRSIAEHEKFMTIIKQDARYQRDHQFIFTTTVIAGDDLLALTA